MMGAMIEDRTPTRVKETHISTLFFVDDRVYKRKKPISTDFVDFTSSGARRSACHREVELNRRLAPDIYLGVADLTMDGSELDHLVVMRRLPEHRRLSALLGSQTASDEIRRLAHLIASFHDTAERSAEIDAACGPVALGALWEDHLDQISRFAGRILDSRDVARVCQLAREYLAGRRPLIEERIAHGHACDGHGDLQADDIFLLDDGPRVLDCLEFDDELRFGDVVADVAFLAMDLERLGHPELADRFLDRYRELSGDTWPSSWSHFHIAARALVRTKVACLRSKQGDASAPAAARALHSLALAHLEAGRVRLVVVGGGPGTGKTTLARELGDRLGAVVIATDVVRDELQPRTQERSGGDGLHAGRYAPRLVDEVYTELIRRAALLLERGESVVLDASWLDPRWREEVRLLASRTHAMLSELRCECPESVVDLRIARRSADGRDASEATAAVAHALTASAEPWPDAIVIDTNCPLGDAVGLAEAVATRR